MTVSIHFARYYLRRWGAYMKADCDLGLGYPKRSTIHKCMIEGVGASQATAPVIAEEPEGVRIMQLIYLDMPDHHREMVDVKYRPHHKGNSIKVCADRLGISEWKFRRALTDAENYVARQLIGSGNLKGYENKC